MTDQNPKTLIVVTGPTAVGKTSLSIELAQFFNAEILSADSRQFYKELNIGVARPDEEELSAVKHHFIAHLSVHDYYNVSKYEVEALDRLQHLFSTYNYAIMTGGSGMYIDAVCKGIADLPDADPQLREELNLQLKEEGIEFLRAQLKLLDPDYYQQVDLANPIRIIRALEVILETGKPYSYFRDNTYKKRPFHIIKLALQLERNILNERINLRVDEMFEKGLLSEAESLLPYQKLTALNTVGYKELFDYFNQKISFDQAKEDIKTHTRRYAKRQMTWYRKDPDIVWFNPSEKVKIIQYIEQQRRHEL